MKYWMKRQDLEKSTEEPEGGRANEGATMLLLWCRREGPVDKPTGFAVMHQSMHMQL